MSAEKITKEEMLRKAAPAIVELNNAWNKFIISTAHIVETPSQMIAAVAYMVDSLFHSFMATHLEIVKKHHSQAEAAADAPEKTEGGAE
jgi:hypothetical protein